MLRPVGSASGLRIGIAAVGRIDPARGEAEADGLGLPIRAQIRGVFAPLLRQRAQALVRLLRQRTG